VGEEQMAQRIFVVVGHTAAIAPDFTLNDLPGSAGRMDILCRCVTGAFCLSHGIRPDVNVYLVLQDRVTVRFEGARLKRLNPDERSTGALIQRALEALQGAHGTGERQSTPGVFVSWCGLQSVLDELSAQGCEPLVLHEHGRDIRSSKLESSVAFVMSDHRDFTSHEEAQLERFEKVSLGPRVLHADHCVTIVHNELDRRWAGWLQ
jgi:tRNA (pseudouridine54-N1)-methyltransferase